MPGNCCCGWTFATSCACLRLVETKRHIRNNDRSRVIKEDVRPSQSARWNIHESANNNTCVKLNWAAAASRSCRLFPTQSHGGRAVLQSRNAARLPLIWRGSSSAAISLAGSRARTAPSPGCRLPGSSHSRIAWAAKPTHTHTRRQKIKHTPPLISNHKSVSDEIK